MYFERILILNNPDLVRWNIISIWNSLYSGYKYWGPIQLYFLRIPIYNNLDLPHWNMIFTWKSLHSGYKCWGPIQLYVLRIPIFNNLDLPPGITLPYWNPYILDTNTEVQSNCIFCESRFLIILICPPGISFSYWNHHIWLQILRPNPIVFSANPDF